MHKTDLERLLRLVAFLLGSASIEGVFVVPYRSIGCIEMYRDFFFFIIKREYFRYLPIGIGVVPVPVRIGIRYRCGTCTRYALGYWYVPARRIVHQR